MSLACLLDRLGLRRRAETVVDRIGVLQPLRVRDFAFLWTGLAVSFVGDGVYIIAISLDWMISIAGVPLSFAVVGPAADVFGVDATLIAAGVLGGAITLAFMFYPGARGPEQDGSIEAARAEGSEVPAPA